MIDIKALIKEEVLVLEKFGDSGRSLQETCVVSGPMN